MCLWGHPHVVGAKIVPGLLEQFAGEDAVVTPNAPYHMKVGIGRAKFLRFSCASGLADVVISVASYSENADPLLIVSTDPDDEPRLHGYHSSSLAQWREDSDANHYAMAQMIGPRGGIMGVINMRRFSDEELNAVVSVQCAYIIAFDAFFWNQLRSSHVCPVGGRKDSASFCSGKGRCEEHGVCLCDGDYAGAACEHRKRDVVVATEGEYTFQIASGHYEYIRVRVPPHFPGGFLEVLVTADVPMVLLIRGDALPTKSAFDLSNFDDWVEHRKTSALKLKVESPRGFQGGDGDSLGSAGDSARTTDGMRCPNPGALLQAQGSICQGSEVKHCKEMCKSCVSCVPGVPNGSFCNTACEFCKSRRCTQKLVACARASNVTCFGPAARRCEADCGSCMACLDSNDRNCGRCECCAGCFPTAAKCNFLQRDGGEYTPFMFVGLYNHRRYYNGNATVRGEVLIKLVEDPDMGKDDLPTSWIAELHDPFYDIRSVEASQGQLHADSEGFLYELGFGDDDGEMWNLTARLFRDRLTLIRLHDLPAGHIPQLRLLGGSKVSHVLSSSRAAPKTFFDFDEIKVASQHGGHIDLHAAGRPSVWCALFGATDGVVDLEVRLKPTAQRTTPPPSRDTVPVLAGAGTPAASAGIALAGVLVGLCSIAVMCVACGRKTTRQAGERVGAEAVAELTERFVGLLRGQQNHESTMPLTRLDTLSNYEPNFMDPAVEDLYLQRGGWGDDGI